MDKERIKRHDKLHGEEKHCGRYECEVCEWRGFTQPEKDELSEEFEKHLFDWLVSIQYLKWDD